MALESNKKSCQQVCHWIILCNRKQILCSLLQLNHLLLLKRFSLLQLLQYIYQIVYVVSVTIHIDKFSKIHALIACLSSANLCPFPLPFLPSFPPFPHIHHSFFASFIPSFFFSSFCKYSSSYDITAYLDNKMSKSHQPPNSFWTWVVTQQ